MTPLLTARGVVAGYDAGQVLAGLDMTITAGQVVNLSGRNGMGKSTFIRVLLGLLPLREGSLRFGDQSLRGLTPDQIARLGVAIVPEGRLCFPNLSVKEHLTAFTAKRNPNAKTHWDLQRVFALFPRLAERADNLGVQLSGGEQQMLAIGRALVTNPRLLILDEATEGLAPRIRDEIWACLAQLKAENQTILIVDKYIDKLLALADQHIILEKGQVVWHGDSNALIADKALWRRYLGV